MGSGREKDGRTGAGGELARDDSAQLAKGRRLLEEGKVEHAIIALGAALAESPRDPEAAYWRGRAFEAAGRTGAAEDDYRVVLSLRPGHAGAVEAVRRLREAPAEMVPADEVAPKAQAGAGRLLPLLALLCLPSAFGLLSLHNNVSLRKLPATAFALRLERAVGTGADYLAGSSAWIEPDPYVVHAAGQATPALQSGSRLFPLRQACLFSVAGTHWERLLSPTTATPVPGPTELASWPLRQRWLAYAAAPLEVVVADEVRESLFAPERYTGATLLDQLQALILYRSRGGASEDVDALLDDLCARVASECAWDFRVTELYARRVALLLAAGKADLVKQRWVERLIAAQGPSGGWPVSWHGWGPHLRQWSGRPPQPTPAATVNAVWALETLKRRNANLRAGSHH